MSDDALFDEFHLSFRIPKDLDAHACDAIRRVLQSRAFRCALRYDNFQGYWGDQQQLDRFLQIYAVERAKQEARQKGYPVSEQALQDGSIKVQIIEGL